MPPPHTPSTKTSQLRLPSRPRYPAFSRLNLPSLKRMCTLIGILDELDLKSGCMSTFTKTRKRKSCADASVEILNGSFSKCRLMSGLKSDTVETAQLRTASLFSRRHLHLHKWMIYVLLSVF